MSGGGEERGGRRGGRGGGGVLWDFCGRSLHVLIWSLKFCFAEIILSPVICTQKVEKSYLGSEIYCSLIYFRYDILRDKSN